jgi:hypothetical protein
MPQWLSRVVRRIRTLASARDVLFTLKALRELAGLELGLDVEDACDLLAKLTVEDSAGRVASAATGEWMYLFKPQGLRNDPLRKADPEEQLRGGFLS